MALSAWGFSVSTMPHILKCIVYLFLFRLISIAIHEISHFIAFAAFKIEVTELTVSVFKLERADNNIKLSIKGNKVFSGGCTWVYSSTVKPCKYIIALCAGGASNLLISAICAVLLATGNISMELLLLLSLSFYNFAVNLLSPASTDRKLIKMITDKQRDK